MATILMLVINPMTADTRVDKEAATLAGAGHDVTVVALAATDLPFRERRAGFEIVRLPYRRSMRDATIAPWQRARIRRHELAASRRALDGIPGSAGERLVTTGAIAAEAVRTVAAGTQYAAGGLLLKFLRTRTLIPSYWESIATRIPALVARPDVICAHDLGPLAATVRLADWWSRTGDHRPRVVYDSHELYVEQQTSWEPRERRMWEWHERRWIRRVDLVITVSDGIAGELQRRYGLARVPTVVLNSPPSEAAHHPSDVRRDAGVGPGDRLAVYVGAAKPGRGVDLLVPAIAKGDWHLALVGAGSGSHIDGLAAMAADGGYGHRLHLLPSVPAATLGDYLRTADIGVHPMEPTCLNHRLALPNKLFDYLFARLPVAVSDLPEMGGLVKRHGLGHVFDPHDPASIRRAMDAAVLQTHEVAPDLLAQLGWDNQADHLLTGYSDILEPRPQTGHG